MAQDLGFLLAGMPLHSGFPAQRQRAAPRGAGGAIAAEQRKWPHRGGTAPLSRLPQQRLATPDRSIVAEPRTVPGEDQPIAILSKLSCQSRRMRFVMKYFSHRQAHLPRELCRRVTGMGVAQDGFGGHAIQRLQVGNDLFQQGHAARRVHVAEMRRDDGPASPAQRDGVLELATQGQQRPWQGEWQFDFQRCIAASRAEAGAACPR